MVYKLRIIFQRTRTCATETGMADVSDLRHLPRTPDHHKLITGLLRYKSHHGSHSFDHKLRDRNLQQNEHLYVSDIYITYATVVPISVLMCCLEISR